MSKPSTNCLCKEWIADRGCGVGTIACECLVPIALVQAMDGLLIRDAEWEQ